VIAVTSLAGHAFGSWRSRETLQMWLKDFLPYDIPNIRIMTYGYDSSLVGNSKTESTLLDYEQNFTLEIENARNSVPVSILMSREYEFHALISSKENPTYHIHRSQPWWDFDFASRSTTPCKKIANSQSIPRH